MCRSTQGWQGIVECNKKSIHDPRENASRAVPPYPSETRALRSAQIGPDLTCRCVKRDDADQTWPSPEHMCELEFSRWTTNEN